MRKLLVLLIFVSISCLSFSQQTDKLTPRLQKELDTQDKVETIIVLKEQFDTDKADSKKGKFAKAAFLFRELNALADRTQQRLRSFFDENQIQYQAFYIINALHARLNKEELHIISGFPEVRSIHYNSSFKIPEAVGNTTTAEKRAAEWGIKNIKADSVWSEYNVRGSGAIVGGQDTGYDWDHEALKNQYRGWDSDSMTVDHDYNWHDAIDSTHEHNSGTNPCGYELAVPCDDNGHGTHTAGTMVGDDGGSNQIGVAPEAEWIGCRNMERGWGTLASYMECFEWFMAPYPYNSNPSNGDPFYAPDVINNSWSCPPIEGCDTSNFAIMRNMVENVRNSGIVVVVSAGNSGPSCNSVSTPAAIYDASFTVGATNSSDDIAGFSSRGTVNVDSSGRMKPDVAAPGVNVRSSTPNDNYGNKSGTSMAGPHVAGAVALMISAVPALSGEVDSIESILKRTARPMSVSNPCGNINPGETPNNEYGHGIIDVYAAVEEAMVVLPVRLLSFSGRAEKRGNVLRWKTTAEQNLSHYTIERSTSGIQWNSIGTVRSRDYYNSPQTYTFLDEKPPQGKAYYRLKSIDNDGKFSYSNAIVVYRSVTESPITVYPNPSNSRLYLESDNIHTFNGYTITIFNMLSQMVAEKKISGNSVDLDLSAGIYFYRLMNKEGYMNKSGKLILR